MATPRDQDDLTASVPLQLATPAALRAGLEQLGLFWSPVPYSADVTELPGLYAWSTGDPDPMRGGVLYVGVGAGAGGVRARLRDERGWVTPDAEHGHGRAMWRTEASPVGGPVQRKDVDLGWLDEQLASRGAQKVRDLLDKSGLDAVVVAERVAIRMALHLGDTPPPVNSRHTTAWASDAPEDWAGFGAASRLRAAKPRSAGGVLPVPTPPVDDEPF